MSAKFFNIFPKKQKIVIGAIHLAPLIGYPQYPGFDITLKNALTDLATFEQGGVDGLIFENNYDIPHQEFVKPETVEIMQKIGSKIKQSSKLPIGINVLWNDYKSGLTIAKELNLQFIRIPVFVDKIETRYGQFTGEPDKILEFQKSLGAENIAIFTDIHVKHSKILSETTIEEAARQAIAKHSDGLIITGRWTGDAPDYSELQTVRQAISNFPIIVGSGSNKDNINDILKYANAVIVSTSLKEGESDINEKDNIKTWQQRISQIKVEEFIKIINQ